MTYSSTASFVHQLYSVHPRRIYCAVDRVVRLSLYEEALRIVSYAEQIDALRIGRKIDLQRAVGIGAGFV